MLAKHSLPSAERLQRKQQWPHLVLVLWLLAEHRFASAERSPTHDGGRKRRSLELGRSALQLKALHIRDDPSRFGHTAMDLVNTTVSVFQQRCLEQSNPNASVKTFCGIMANESLSKAAKAACVLSVLKGSNKRPALQAAVKDAIQRAQKTLADKEMDMVNVVETATKEVGEHQKLLQFFNVPGMQEDGQIIQAIGMGLGSAVALVKANDPQQKKIAAKRFGLQVVKIALLATGFAFPPLGPLLAGVAICALNTLAKDAVSKEGGINQQIEQMVMSTVDRAFLDHQIHFAMGYTHAVEGQIEDLEIMNQATGRDWSQLSPSVAMPRDLWMSLHQTSTFTRWSVIEHDLALGSELLIPRDLGAATAADGSSNIQSLQLRSRLATTLREHLEMYQLVVGRMASAADATSGDVFEVLVDKVWRIANRIVPQLVLLSLHTSNLGQRPLRIHGKLLKFVQDFVPAGKCTGDGLLGSGGVFEDLALCVWLPLVSAPRHRYPKNRLARALRLAQPLSVPSVKRTDLTNWHKEIEVKKNKKMFAPKPRESVTRWYSDPVVEEPAKYGLKILEETMEKKAFQSFQCRAGSFVTEISLKLVDGGMISLDKVWCKDNPRVRLVPGTLFEVPGKTLCTDLGVLRARRGSTISPPQPKTPRPADSFEQRLDRNFVRLVGLSWDKAGHKVESSICQLAHAWHAWPATPSQQEFAGISWQAPPGQEYWRQITHVASSDVDACSACSLLNRQPFAVSGVNIFTGDGLKKWEPLNVRTTMASSEWDPKKINYYAMKEDPTCSMAVSGAFLFIGTSHGDVEMWSVHEVDGPLRTFHDVHDVMDKQVCSVVVSGNYLFSASHNTVKMWAIDDSTKVQSFNTGAVSLLALSGESLFTCSRNKVTQWSIETGNMLNTFTTPGDVQGIAADAGFLFTAHGSSTIEVRDEAGEHVTSLEHKCDILSIAVLQDHAVAGCADGTVTLWSVATGDKRDLTVDGALQTGVTIIHDSVSQLDVSVALDAEKQVVSVALSLDYVWNLGSSR